MSSSCLTVRGVGVCFAQTVFVLMYYEKSFTALRIAMYVRINLMYGIYFFKKRQHYFSSVAFDKKDISHTVYEDVYNINLTYIV